MYFKCSIGRDGDVPVIHARGEIDMVTAPRLARCLHTALAENRGRVVLNLRDVTFVDGKGLRTLERFARDCRAHGVTFALTRVAPRIRDLIELVGLDRLLLILDSGQGKHEGARSVQEVSDDIG